jgi:hypothetical protein
LVPESNIERDGGWGKPTRINNGQVFTFSFLVPFGSFRLAF